MRPRNTSPIFTVERFIYENNSGYACIDKQVLAAFRKLTGDSLVVAASAFGVGANWR